MDEPIMADENKKIDRLAQAVSVLEDNDYGYYTVPSTVLYPHQWLWDSCFISIGQRHFDVDRAQTELLSLLRGQWSNGMLPNIIFNDEPRYWRDRELWQSKISPLSPDNVATSGITQPPMLAEAVTRVGQKLPKADRRVWYKMVFPGLVAYHQWLYNDRDPHKEGLVLQIHPWETGADNNPAWMSAMKDHLMPWWIRIVERLHLDIAMNIGRRDSRHVTPSERYSNIEALVFLDCQRRLHRKAYNIGKILDHSLFSIEDLMFNSIFIRANSLLRDIAKTIRTELPEDLLTIMGKSEKTFEELWDPYTGQYYSRDFITHQLLKTPSIAALMPLYAGSISKERADKLVKMLENHHLFGSPYPVPTVPLNSSWFKPKRYWQGPSWVNTNWLIIDGLKRYGYIEHADALRSNTLMMIEESGMSEYFDPINGEPAGIDNFSWTAALYIDLRHAKDKK